MDGFKPFDLLIDSDGESADNNDELDEFGLIQDQAIDIEEDDPSDGFGDPVQG